MFANANRDPKKGRAFKPSDFFDPDNLKPKASKLRQPTPEETIELFSMSLGAKQETKNDGVSAIN